VTIIASLFVGVRSEDPMAQVRALPQISDDSISKALELEYPLNEFLMYNIVEGFLCQSKQSRVDKDTTKSLRPDLGVRSEGQNMVQEYITKRYSEDYDLRLGQMGGDEKKQLCDELVEQMRNTDSICTFNELLSDGIQRGEVLFKIANFNSQGCLELHEALLDKERPVVKRALKLQVFYTGEDDEQKPVWNGGNMYRTSTKRLEQLLISIGEDVVWSRIQQRYSDKVSHVYRDSEKSNRHGHSTALASYFAFGHDMLVSFCGSVSCEAWADYQKEHHNCCGVACALRKFELEGMQPSVDRLAAKRAKRAECQNNVEKMNAAIEEKKRRKANRLTKVQAQARVGKTPKRKHVAASSADSDSDGSESYGSNMSQ